MTERRTVQISMRGLLWLVLAAVLGPILSITASTMIANRNSERLITQYRADQVRQGEANRKFYCALFDAQLNAFDKAESPAGKAAFQAWLDLYTLAKCQPPRTR